MKLDHTEQLKKITETVRENQSFINKSKNNLSPEKEKSLHPETLQDGSEAKSPSEFV